jgi:hypothetical protein
MVWEVNNACRWLLVVEKLIGVQSLENPRESREAFFIRHLQSSLRQRTNLYKYDFYEAERNAYGVRTVYCGYSVSALVDNDSGIRLLLREPFSNNY